MTDAGKRCAPDRDTNRARGHKFGHLKLYQPKSVMHFAAFAYVGESAAKPLAYYQNIVSGLINVLDAMVRHGADTIVFSSSCTTYGIPEALPIAENARQQPISPYDIPN
jgi:UDP-arabinose 4-epimerase